jgi:hypothetical protein
VTSAFIGRRLFVTHAGDDPDNVRLAVFAEVSFTPDWRRT